LFIIFVFFPSAAFSATWMLIFLAGHQNWRSRAIAEVESLLDRHSPLSKCEEASSTSLSLRLSSIPLEAWENETPILDAIIRETTRLAQPHVAMRRNLGPELYINGKVIPTGAYVIYPFSDVHLNPEIYPDPWRFDPSREEANDAVCAYVGWGGGKKLFTNSPNVNIHCVSFSVSQARRLVLAIV
jgi:sterol 14-demethylase